VVAGGPTPEDAAGRARVPELDGLRGVAILLVVFFHATIVGSGTPTGALLHGVFRNFGWTGVDLFFVLSGFLITGILVDSRDAPRALRHFYARRALRIFPVYYGFLILVFLIVPRVAPGALSVGDDAVFYWVYLQNFAVAAQGDWVHSRFLNLFWSLAIEEQFYLVWPWVVHALGRRALLRVCLAMIAGSLALRVVLVAADVAPVAIYVLTPARLDGLAAGALVALALRSSGGTVRLAAAAPYAAVLSGIGILALVVWQRGFSYKLPGTATAGLTLLAVFFAALLVLTLRGAPQGPLRRLLGTAPLRAWGRTSYAVYVTHQVVLVLATLAWVRLFFEPHAPGAGELTLQITVYATVLPGCWLVGEASWRWVEAPLLRWKRRFPLAGAAKPPS
jgi:peptidoglycan/LPS O-acetylase OafA/YrhL